MHVMRFNGINLLEQAIIEFTFELFELIHRL